MYKGVYEGSKVKLLNKKILVLGESHYSNDGNCKFTTKSVIENYCNILGELFEDLKK